MPDVIALGFDTSAAHCAAALLLQDKTGDRVLAERLLPMTKGQAERLFPLLEELLAEARLNWRDLSVIGVGTGPGNFTGIRIAVAAARGLALSLGVPAIGVPATEAMALGLPRPCRVVIPGKNDQIIWQDFDSGDSPTEARPQQAAAGSLPPGPDPAPPAMPLAVAIARIALTRRDDPLPRPAPIYLRPADAAPARDATPVILS